MEQEKATKESPQSGVQLLVDERDLRQIFTNSYRIHATAEEVIVDLGFNMPNPNPARGKARQMLLKIPDRAIMSYTTAKKLSVSLHEVVQRHEEQFGEAGAPAQRKK